MLRWWTLGRAIAGGAVAGLMALVLWPAYAAVGEALLIPYLAALAIAAICGFSILWITAADLLFHRRRGGRIIAVRVFDVALGLFLLLPSATALRTLL
jgi:hypothetical protein